LLQGSELLISDLHVAYKPQLLQYGEFLQPAFVILEYDESSQL
jgi:hypothetical protein